MVLRPPKFSDREWMTRAYQDWPNERDFITESSVHGFLRRWIERGDVVCRVAELDGQPVGLMTYKAWFVGAWVFNAVVLPEYRGQGIFREMRRLLRDELVASGVVVAVFETLPGPLEGKYPGNRVTWDMEI